MERSKATEFDLDAVTITAIEEGDRAHGRVSIIEAVARWAGEEPNLEPRCASPVLTTLLGMWNEGLRDSVEEQRQDLKRFVPRLARSVAPDLEDVRRWMVVDWLVRVCVPEVLLATDRTELHDAAEPLRWLPPLESDEVGRHALALMGQAEEVAEACHRVCKPDAYLRPGRSWDRAAARTGALAAWNVLVQPWGCSLVEPDEWLVSEIASDVGRRALRVVELTVGLLAEPAARAEFRRLSGTPAVLPPGSGAGGHLWANRVVSESERIGQHVYAVVLPTLDVSLAAVVSSFGDLLDRLLELTDEAMQA